MTTDDPATIPATLQKRHTVWELDPPRGYLLETTGREHVEFIPARLEARLFHTATEGTITTLTAAGPRIRPDGTPTPSMRTVSWRLGDAPEWAQKIYHQEMKK